MKIYTKRGDKGETSLIGGTRVSKSDLRIECYGTVDELNSYIGLIRDQDIDKGDYEDLISIQNLLFTIGALLAKDPDKKTKDLPQISESDIDFLEKKMDTMNNDLPPIKHFILPGGHSTVSYSHIARCVCRKAERLVVNLSHQSNVDNIIIKYLNRLSDYLFVLSRKLGRQKNITETPWIPGI